MGLPPGLPAAELAKATGIKVHLYGSLSATGKGHGGNPLPPKPR